MHWNLSIKYLTVSEYELSSHIYHVCYFVAVCCALLGKILTIEDRKEMLAT